MPIQKRKITAGAVTTLILVLLIIAGPAQAFTLNLQVDNDVVEQGKKITFTASVDINSGENIPIEELVLILDGPEHRECVFDITGKMKDNWECHGINIKKLPYPQIQQGYGYRYGYSHGYGYDFGYGYGYTDNLEYEITLHSQKFEVGGYESYLKIKTENKKFTEKGPDFEIKNKPAKEKKQESSGGNPTGCLTVWECTDWGECVNGQQTRACGKAENFCSLKKGDKKPEEKRKCSVEAAEVQTAEVNNEIEPIILETEEQTTNTKKNQPNSLSKVTGAVGAATEEGVLGAIVVTVILAGMLMVGLKLLINRRKMQKFFAYKRYDFY